MRSYTITKQIRVVFVILLCYLPSSAQVGINTITPRKTLEVNGNVQISGNLDIGTVNDLTNSDTYTFLMQEPSGNIKALDVANVSLGNALGYLQTYEIQEVYYDFLRDFDTGIDSTQYVMTVNSCSFDREVAFFPSQPTDGFAIPSVQAFVENGTWHLKANYPTITTNDLSNGTWTIETIIFTSDLVKQFSQQVFNMSNTTTGSATTAILN